jgi:Tfp pilus assembly protein PilF
MFSRVCPLLFLFSFSFLAPCVLLAQQQQELANIFGQLRVATGDFPSHQIQIELLFRGSPVMSAYADTEGKFGFNNLVEGEYHVIINDEGYYPVDERLMVRPDISTIVMARLILRPREITQVRDPAGARAAGSNPSLIDLSEYNRRFPKKAIKQYEKGLHSDQQSRRDDAIPHYEAALKIAPDYYPAHNNLGSDYLSKSDFPNARKEFEEVIRLNQSDAQAYFNLSNVCMMSGQLADAQRYLEEGMRREPDSAFGLFLLGSLDIKTGKLTEAETSLRQTIQLSPTMAQARLQLVNLFLQEERKPEAADQLRDFVKTFPDSTFTPRARQLLQRLNTPAQRPTSR